MERVSRWGGLWISPNFDNLIQLDKILAVLAHDKGLSALAKLAVLRCSRAGCVHTFIKAVLDERTRDC